MATEKHIFVLRYMKYADIDHVMEIERMSFTLPWSRRSYLFELQNPESTFLVIAPKGPRLSVVQRILSHRRVEPPIGFCGFWHIADEVHISTIAVHREWRGIGLGSLLMASVMSHALGMKASLVTLEVRESNLIAQQLYRRYGFEFVGRRRGYYRDNMEDALLMTVQPLGTAYRDHLSSLVTTLMSKLEFEDYTRWPVRSHARATTG